MKRDALAQHKESRKKVRVVEEITVSNNVDDIGESCSIAPDAGLSVSTEPSSSTTETVQKNSDSKNPSDGSSCFSILSYRYTAICSQWPLCTQVSVSCKIYQFTEDNTAPKAKSCRDETEYQRTSKCKFQLNT